jgi:hypothetical protein
VATSIRSGSLSATATRLEVSSSAILRPTKARREPINCSYQQRQRQRIARSIIRGRVSLKASSSSSRHSSASANNIPQRNPGERRSHYELQSEVATGGMLASATGIAAALSLLHNIAELSVSGSISGVRKRADCRRWRGHRLVRCGSSLGGILCNPVPQSPHGHAKQTRRQRSLGAPARSSIDRLARQTHSTPREPLTYSLPMQGGVRAHSNINSQTQYLCRKLPSSFELFTLQPALNRPGTRVIILSQVRRFLSRKPAGRPAINRGTRIIYPSMA